jgi:hypothetical protein
LSSFPCQRRSRSLSFRRVELGRSGTLGYVLDLERKRGKKPFVIDAHNIAMPDVVLSICRIRRVPGNATAD